MPHHGRAVAASLGLTGDLAKQATKVLASLYAAFVGSDAEQIEINPLAVTDGGQLMVLDAKISFDGNAMFRHKDLAELRDLSEEDSMEIEASKYDLAYIKLKGILVNIFGGIMKCDIIADGIVAAAREVDLKVPLVVRLEGTNVQQGKDILANSGLPIVAANDLGDAAQKIVAEVKNAA
jgi:succinyl-CoA synthetase beta subunit